MKIVLDTCKICSKEYRKTGQRQLYCSTSCQYKSRNSYLRNWISNNPEKSILAGAKCRAKRNGTEFNINEADINIPSICPVLKIPIKRNTGSGFHFDSPSLDRIDNTKGYTKGNCRVISNRANLLKSDASLEELELLVEDARRT